MTQQSGSSLPTSSQSKTNFMLSTKHVLSKGQVRAGGWECGKSYYNPSNVGYLYYMTEINASDDWRELGLCQEKM